VTKALTLALFIVIGLSMQARSDSSARDDLSIEAVGTSEAVVTYHNHAAGFSRNGTQRRSVDISGGQMISVDVEIEVGAGPGGAELATVTPDGDFIAIPPFAYVLDGDTQEFKIMLPMY